MKIATPISVLFQDKNIREKIALYSDCLECREETLESESPKQYLFHFDRSIVNVFSDEDRDYLVKVFNMKKELKMATFHISSSCSCPVLKDGMFTSGGKAFSRQQMIQNASSNVDWIKSQIVEMDLNIIVAVENNNYYPTNAYQYITDADFISQIVNDNDIYFLFDIAHAQITAHNKKIIYDKYFEKLPISRIKQVHISKYGINNNGLAFDEHGQPDGVVFKEIEDLVEKIFPEYLAIEYYKDGNTLAGLLQQYRTLCDERKLSK